MKPMSIKHIQAMRDIHYMNDVEIWRDAMCAEMPSEQGICQTPDGEIKRVSHCTGCRYSNKVNV